MRYILLILLSLFLLTSCCKDACDTPFGEGGTIDLTYPEFSNLYNNPGGTLVLNRGHRGIIVNCVGFGSYVAFECACPKDHNVRMFPDNDKAAVILTCPNCGSKFEIMYGQPLEGSATGCSLYQYNCTSDGRLLTIY